MNSRERVLAALHHRQPDRVPYTDNPWSTTLERWRAEGFAADADPAEFFGYDFAGFGADPGFLFPEEVLEETDETITKRDHNGVVMMNWKHRTSTPMLISHLCATPAAWAGLKRRVAWKPERVNWDDAARCRRFREKGKFVPFMSAIGYDLLSTIVGPETLLPAMLDEPEWVCDMFRTFTDLAIASAEEMTAGGFEFDGAFVFDDLGYRNGTFFSTDLYREMLQPEHRRLCDYFHGRGWKVILHSCGNVTAHVPALIDAGFDCLQPLEVKAGMDLFRLKKDFGDRLAFMGGLDVRAMADPDPAAIEREIRTKMEVAKVGGGYIAHSDHSIPDNVSLAQYRRTVDLIRENGCY